MPYDESAVEDMAGVETSQKSQQDSMQAIEEEETKNVPAAKGKGKAKRRGNDTKARRERKKRADARAGYRGRRAGGA